MDFFSQYSSGSDCSDKLDCLVMYEANTPNGTAMGAFHSDEEVMLASSHPKKRAGRKKFKETRHPVYRGIRKRNKDKWVCELREPVTQTRVWLGSYPTAEMAARAHDVAALAFRGRSACLNYADSAWRLPAPASMDPKDIRRAAAEAAEAFRTQESEGSGSGTEQAFQGSAVEASEVVSSNNASSQQQDLDAFSENMFSIDEHLPGLLADMANGLLISPPPVGDYSSWDNTGNDGGVSLWSYSM